MPTLSDVYSAIEEDSFWDHLRGKGTRLVPGFGHLRPKVLLVGEAPGATEARVGRPFCGKSGKVLEQLMDLAGIALQDKEIEAPGHGDKTDPAPFILSANAFVTNVVKYRPMGNRTPTLAEILHARKSLRQEWAALGGPRVIVCVGAVAHTAMSPMGHDPVSRWHGTPVYRGSGLERVWFISQFHPAFGLRNRNNQSLLYRIERDWTSMGGFLQEEGLL